MAEKQTTLGKVVESVKDAALSVAHAADAHVVQPVGKVLGLVKREKPKGIRSSLNKTKRKAIASAVAGKRKSAKRTAAAKKLTSKAKKTKKAKSGE